MMLEPLGSKEGRENQVEKPEKKSRVRERNG